MNVSRMVSAQAPFATAERTNPAAAARLKTAPGLTRLKYRPDVDGLRAIAVLSVILFHMDVGGFGGGFVGVDVFFVISGYLISAIVFSEIAEGTYSVTSFYERRIRRIFPALFAMLFAFTACSLLYIFPSEMVNYAKSLLAATTSVSNFYFWQHSGYFDSPTSNPLLHTWSLAVEEQFYIFFPLYLWAVRRFSPQRLRSSVVVLFFLSLAASAVVVVLNPTTAFYMPYTRAWELLLGTLLSLKVFPKLNTAPLRNLGSLLGAAMVGYSVVAYKSAMLFPGLSALVPCIGSALLIHAGESGSSVIGKVLSWRPVVFVGLISYSLYLWHWPVLILHKMGVLLGISTTLPPSLIARISIRRYDDAVEIILSFVLAILCWMFIEQPFRKGRLKLRGRPLFLLTAATVGLSVGFCIFAIASKGIPGRLAPAAELVASYSSSITNVHQSLRRGECFITPEYSMKDFNYAQCMKVVPGKENFLLVGDSHSATLWPGLSRLMPSANILQASVSACRPILHPAGSSTCNQMMHYIYQDFLPHNAIQGVLLEARWESKDIPGLSETIQWAKQNHLPIYLFGTVPEYDAPLPRLLGYSIAWQKPDFAARHRTIGPAELDAQLQKLSESSWHIAYISLYQILCSHSTCTEYADQARTIPMLADTDHFTEPGSLYIARKIVDLGELR